MIKNINRILDGECPQKRRPFPVAVKITVLWNDGEISEAIADDTADTLLIYSEYTNDENFDKLEKFTRFDAVTTRPISGSTITIKLTDGIATIEIL